MNSKILVYVFLFSSLLILSCSKKTAKLHLIEEIVQKQSISFSIDLNSDVGNLTMIDKEDFVIAIKNFMKNIMHYKKVIYTTQENKTENHMHFQLVITRTRDSEQPALSAISRLTLLIIPRTIQYYSDFTVFLFNNDKEIFSSIVSNKFNSIVWLPLIVLNPVINDFFIAKLVLDAQLPYLLNQVENYRQ